MDKDGEVVVEHHGAVAPVGDLRKHPPRLLLDPVPDHLEEVIGILLDHRPGQFQAGDLLGECFLLPEEVVRARESPGLFLDIHLEAVYLESNGGSLLPRREEVSLALQGSLLCCRDRLFAEPEPFGGLRDPEPFGLPLRAEGLLRLQRLDQPRDFFEADAEFERPMMRRLSATELLALACEPVGVERETGEFVPDSLQPPFEGGDPCGDVRQFLFQRRPPREPGLRLRVCPPGRLKRLRLGFQALPDRRIEPEQGEFRLDLLFSDEITLDVGDEPLPLFLEGGEAAALPPEGVGRRPHLQKNADPLLESGVRRRIVPLHAERPNRRTVTLRLGPPPLCDARTLLIPGRVERVLLF